MAAKPTAAPDYLTLPPYALLVADALTDAADTMEKHSIEVGQQRVMAPLVQMLKRAGNQTRAYAEDEPQA